MYKLRKLILITAIIALNACDSGNSGTQSNPSQSLDTATPEISAHATPVPSEAPIDALPRLATNYQPSAPRQPTQPTQPQPTLPTPSTLPSAPSATSNISEWNLLYSAKCDTLSPQKCLGGYGFKLSSDGSFQVGPAPQGEKYESSVNQKDLKIIKEILNGFLKHTTAGRVSVESCIPVELTQTNSSVVLNFSGSNRDLLRHSKEQLCFSDLTPKEAQTLSTALERVVSKYHPTEFPNPCIDAVKKLEDQYTELKECKSDEDCTFLDELYVPANSRNPDSVVTDDCSLIRPLGVANRFKVTSNQLKLVLDRENTRVACGEYLKRPGCKHWREFDPTEESPICGENNLCQLK